MVWQWKLCSTGYSKLAQDVNFGHISTYCCQQKPLWFVWSKLTCLCFVLFHESNKLRELALSTSFQNLFLVLIGTAFASEESKIVCSQNYVRQRAEDLGVPLMDFAKWVGHLKPGRIIYASPNASADWDLLLRLNWTAVGRHGYVEMNTRHTHT